MQDEDQSGGFAGEFAVCVPVRRRLAYWIPSHFSRRAAVGARALVPVGKRRVVGFYMGRADFSPGRQGRRKMRQVECFLDEKPFFSGRLLEFLLRAAEYYRHPEGMVLKTAMGPRADAAGKRRFEATPSGLKKAADGGLTELEARVVQLAGKSPKTQRQIERYVPLLDRERLGGMLEKGLIAEAERPGGDRVNRDERTCIFLGAKDWDEDPALSDRQKDLLETLRRRDGVTLAALRRSFPVRAGDLKKLRKEGYLKTEDVSGAGSSEAPDAGGPPEEPGFELNDSQKNACAMLDAALARGGFETFLMFGVTGSGKTEVYLRTIQQALKLGKSSVVIVPEIALTPQLLETFRRRIGGSVAVIHSGLSASARKREMKDIAEGRKRVVVGARSALFSSVVDPGVFVVDEEHDHSLKQEEGFRYHARDMAILRAREEGAVAVLSSATPSLESFYNATKGKYKLITLPARVSRNPLPEVEVINERRHLYGPQKQAFVSMPLYKAISDTLASGGQVIIFLNRRGYAPISVCRECGQSIRCPHCSVSLTYHRFTSRLSCHHCGYSRPAETRCPSCGAADAIVIRGPGTERIEEVVSGLFPSARVVRMDSDVASGMASEPILRKLREGRADILVGTQMITKGHDLPKVALVGVVRADAELHFPDFRSSERTFSVLTQVAGRAGRGVLPGRVILQTFNPDHPAIEAACRQNYPLFYSWEIKNRRTLLYPPFSHLALVRLEGREEKKVLEKGRALVEVMKGAAGTGARGFRILGPAPSPLERLKSRYRYQILVKSETRKHLGEVVDRILDEKHPGAGGVRVIVDIDPLDFM